MFRTRVGLVCSIAVCASALIASPAFASDIGQTVASRFDVATYQSVLDNQLYTHLGDNKGLNGPEHGLCRDAIVSAMQGHGWSVQLEPFTYLGNTYHNVVATKTGTHTPNQQFIIGAHFDTVNNPGADDDASGVAALIELARILAPFESRSTIKLIAFDREEQGKIGSTAYVAQHPGAQVQAMIQLDMIAHDVGTNRENMYGNAASLPLKQAMVAAAALYGNGINVVDVGNATFSDHAPFAAAGYQAIAFVEHNFQQFGCYHQPCDSVDTPNYIHYGFASNLGRSVAGYLADHAGVWKPGDVTADGLVNVADLLAAISAWGPCPASPPPPRPPVPCPADLNSDGAVNVADLLDVISNWG